MSVCTDLLWESDFGRVFCGSVSANVKAPDNIFTGDQTMKGFLLPFHVDLILPIDTSAFLKTSSVQIWF